MLQLEGRINNQILGVKGLNQIFLIVFLRSLFTGYTLKKFKFLVQGKCCLFYIVPSCIHVSPNIINMNWKFKLTSDNILASLMASTVSSGCSSPTNISFKTFLNVLRKKFFSYKKILQTCSGRSLFNNEFWSLFQRFFWWTLNLPHIDSFFFFFTMAWKIRSSLPISYV